jgi:TatD DNase family protein
MIPYGLESLRHFLQGEMCCSLVLYPTRLLLLLFLSLLLQFRCGCMPAVPSSFVRACAPSSSSFVLFPKTTVSCHLSARLHQIAIKTAATASARRVQCFHSSKECAHAEKSSRKAQPWEFETQEEIEDRRRALYHPDYDSVPRWTTRPVTSTGGHRSPLDPPAPPKDLDFDEVLDWDPDTGLFTDRTRIQDLKRNSNCGHIPYLVRKRMPLIPTFLPPVYFNMASSTALYATASNTPSSSVESIEAANETEHAEEASKPIRLVDVDCNLWHKDLLTLLLPKLPPSSFDTNGGTNETTNEDEISIPECLQILQNDHLPDVIAMISPSSTLTEAERGLQILRDTFDHADGSTSNNILPYIHNIRLRTTIGIHPYHVSDPFHFYPLIDDEQNDSHPAAPPNADAMDITSLMDYARKLLNHTPNRKWICAIGECGLDTTQGFPPIAYQIPFFIGQIELANEYGLPLFLHERGAHDTLLQLLDQHADESRIPRIIVHCFTGSAQECHIYVERGYFLSLSGFVFRAEEGEAVRFCLEEGILPLDRLMIETDAPYMGFNGCRELFVNKNGRAIHAPQINAKQRKAYSVKQNYPNPPSSIYMIAQQILFHINAGRSKRKESLLSLQELAETTTRNANEFFGLGLEEIM